MLSTCWWCTCQNENQLGSVLEVVQFVRPLGGLPGTAGAVPLSEQSEPCLLGTNVVCPLGLMCPGVEVEPSGGEDSSSLTAVVQLVDE